MLPNGLVYDLLRQITTLVCVGLERLYRQGIPPSAGVEAALRAACDSANPGAAFVRFFPRN